MFDGPRPMNWKRVAVILTTITGTSAILYGTLYAAMTLLIGTSLTDAALVGGIFAVTYWLFPLSAPFAPTEGWFMDPVTYLALGGGILTAYTLDKRLRARGWWE